MPPQYAGDVGGEVLGFGRVEDTDSLDEANGTDVDQVLLGDIPSVILLHHMGHQM